MASVVENSIRVLLLSVVRSAAPLSESLKGAGEEEEEEVGKAGWLEAMEVSLAAAGTRPVVPWFKSR